MADGIAQAFRRRPRARRRGGASAAWPGRTSASRRRGRCRREVDAIIIDVAGREVAKCKTPGRDLRHRRLRPRASWRRTPIWTCWCCAPKTPGADVQKLAEAILYPLWDAKVDAGHAVRAYDQALALPANDLAAATALLDARFLTGDRALADKFLGAFRARVAKTAAEDFVARLRAEQKERHSRFGDTIFLLEPDLKNGPGGMRDLCVGRWAAHGPLRHVAIRSSCSSQGVMTGRLAQAFTAATRVADARPHPDARDGRAAAGSPALRAAGGDRADPLPRGARSRRRHPSGGAPGGRGADAPVPRARQADPQRDRAAACSGRPRATTSAARPSRCSMLRGRQGAPIANFVVRDGALEPKDPGDLRAQAVGDDPDLPGGDRAGRAAGAAHARAARRAGGVAARGCCARTPRRAGASSSSAATRAIAPTRRASSRCRTSGCWPRSCPSGSRRRAACSTTSITSTPSTSTRCTRSGGCTRSRAAITRRRSRSRPRRSARSTRPVALAVGTLLHDVGKPYGSPHSEIGAGLAVDDLPAAGHRRGGHRSGSSSWSASTW